jgi:anti-sigma regulatory factor (Ser/Thr protein kinase)
LGVYGASPEADRPARLHDGPLSGAGALVAQLDLPALPRSPGCARRHAHAALSAWDIAPGVIETAVLLVSELVTNACRAAAAALGEAALPITQTLRYQSGRIIIEVLDPDPRPPVLSHSGTDAESGRGLMLVDALSKEWSYFFPPSGGKITYAILSHDD